jgi:rhodanese-related sulfurtransferase
VSARASAQTTRQERTSAAELLAEARAGLARMTPNEAHAAQRGGALLIDIRSGKQRKRDGVIPDARFVERNVLEWRCDPSSEWSDPEVSSDLSRPVIVFCQEGYQSSLVAATLQRYGFLSATDLIGGFEGWREAGLPVQGLASGDPPGRGHAGR